MNALVTRHWVAGGERLTVGPTAEQARMLDAFTMDATAELAGVSPSSYFIYTSPPFPPWQKMLQYKNPITPTADQTTDVSFYLTSKAQFKGQPIKFVS